eukprot:gene6216-6854_t
MGSSVSIVESEGSTRNKNNNFIPSDEKTTSSSVVEVAVSPSAGGGISLFGICLADYDNFFLTCGGREQFLGLTTQEVVERFIKPITKEDRSSYCDYLLRTSTSTSTSQKKKGNKMVGMATVYVSHCWQAPFLSLIDSLSHYYHGEGEAKQRIYVWIDIFSVNQHHLSGGYYGSYVERIEKVVNTIGNTLVILYSSPAPATPPTTTAITNTSPSSGGSAAATTTTTVCNRWTNKPLCLSRTWCLWEIFLTLQQPNSDHPANSGGGSNSNDNNDITTSRKNSKISFACTREDEVALIDNLASDDPIFLSSSSRHSSIDSILSEASSFEDREMILNLIEDRIGFQGLDHLILSTMRKWICAVIEKVSPSLKNKQPLQYLHLMKTLAAFYMKEEALSHAETIYFDALMMSKNQLGLKHVFTLHLMHLLANCYEQEGQQELAEITEGLYLKCLRRSQDEFDVIPTALKLSVTIQVVKLCLSRCRYHQSEVLLLEALAECRESDHESCLEIMELLASLYSQQGRHKEAEEILLDCLHHHLERLGKDHPKIISFQHALISCYLIQGKSYEVEKLLIDYIEQANRVLGEDHPETLSFMNHLASLYVRLHRCDQAYPIFMKCLTIVRRIHGEYHHRTLSAMNNLAVCCFQLGDFNSAEMLFTACLAKRRMVDGENHPETVEVMNNLAALYLQRSQQSTASAAY